jgi:fatty-acyl-CoA synthase
MPSIFDTDLPRTEANFAPLTPLAFIQRAAEVYPERLAIVHGALRQTWQQTYRAAASWPARCSRRRARTTPWP